MTTYVLDASVAVKWYIPEIDEVAAKSLLAASHDLHVPEMFFPEFGNILWKKVQRGQIDADEAREIAAQVMTVPLIIHRSHPHLEEALDLALSHQRTVYDAYYLALSLDLGCPFITADEKLVNALQPTFGNQIRLIRSLP